MGRVKPAGTRTVAPGAMRCTAGTSWSRYLTSSSAVAWMRPFAGIGKGRSVCVQLVRSTSSAACESPLEFGQTVSPVSIG
eukprot:1195256-Prorocentrum_minimum.AAC.2